MRFVLDRSSPQPLYRQLADHVQRAIRSGALPTGARLPTVRQLAQQAGVTRLTAHHAYGELQSGGWIESVVGRGTFVAERIASQALATDIGREMSARGVIHDMLRLAHLPGIRSLAMADAATDLFPLRDMRRAVEDAAAMGAEVFGASPTQGDALLRTVLVDVVQQRGIQATPDELMITSGVTQGMALLARTLARPGDTVVVEQPTYLGALNVFGAAGLRVLGVPMDDEGMQTDRLESLLSAHNPRFIYTIPTYHNPRGTCMSLARRTHLLALAERHGIPVIEDDIYALISYNAPPAPSLRSMDTRGLVVYISSFSKSLMPGLRMGYLLASPQILNALVNAKQADDLFSSVLTQRALALFIQRGWLQAHIRRTLPHYRARRDALLGAMTRFFPSDVRWNEPNGGFSVWAELPPGIITTDVYLAAIERGLAVVPGDVFFAGTPPQSAIRLSFSTLPPEQLAEAAQSIGQLLGSELTHRRYTTSPISACAPIV